MHFSINGFGPFFLVLTSTNLRGIKKINKQDCCNSDHAYLSFTLDQLPEKGSKVVDKRSSN